MKTYISLGVIVVVLGVGYYALSPLFSTVEVYDPEPVYKELSASSPSDVMVSSFEGISFPVIDTLTHPASGTLRVITQGDSLVLRYEDYKTINGPDLYVYLSKDLEANEFIDLGTLRGTEGNINYEVPPGVSLDEYRYVLTWCKQFGVLFNYVDLKGATLSTPDTGDRSASTTSSMTSKDMTAQELPSSQSDTQTSAAPRADAAVLAQTTAGSPSKTALFGNGCFWCVEHDLEEVKGVLSVLSGYAGGSTIDPTYKDYASGGHREVVEVTYDPSQVSYAQLVEHILKHGDPTDTKGSFGDRGSEYAPALYYDSEDERADALFVLSVIDSLHVFSDPLPIPLIPRVMFFPAEDYHQDYSAHNSLKYGYYRTASGRDSFISKYWGGSEDRFIALPRVRSEFITPFTSHTWDTYTKPSQETLRRMLPALSYRVTQEDETEPSVRNPYDKHFEAGIYVDVVSGEPLFSSRDKFDSGTGWPSFVRPISDMAVILHEDNTLFTKRTEVRSRHADSHLGHVFDDGPVERGGKRYCMNSAALQFIPKELMEREGYGYLLGEI